MTPDDIHQILQREIDDLNRRLSVVEQQQVVSALHAISAQLNHMEKRMDANIQRAIDDIAANKSITASVVAGVALLGSQITDMKQQIADLQAQLAAGNQVTAQDLTDLGNAANDLEASNAQLETVVPANTSAKA